MNANRLSTYDVATWIDHGGDWRSVAALISRARDEAVARLAAPYRLTRALFLSVLAPARVSVARSWLHAGRAIPRCADHVTAAARLGPPPLSKASGCPVFSP
jgi:hypothetical protein